MKKIQISLCKLFIASVLAPIFLFSALVTAEADMTPQQLFSKLESRVNEIPEDWATTNPIRVNVCFNLKHPINSPAADAFLDTLYSTISGLKYDIEIEIYRTLYPVKLDYCATMMFPNWEANRAYETSDEFLTFYKSQWKSAVTDTEEHWAILDTHAGRKKN